MIPPEIRQGFVPAIVEDFFRDSFQYSFWNFSRDFYLRLDSSRDVPRFIQGLLHGEGKELFDFDSIASLVFIR